MPDDYWAGFFAGAMIVGLPDAVESSRAVEAAREALEYALAYSRRVRDPIAALNDFEAAVRADQQAVSQNRLDTSQKWLDRFRGDLAVAALERAEVQRLLDVYAAKSTAVSALVEAARDVDSWLAMYVDTSNLGARKRLQTALIPFPSIVQGAVSDVDMTPEQARKYGWPF